jgi:hypothetical protein
LERREYEKLNVPLGTWYGIFSYVAIYYFLEFNCHPYKEI